MSSINQVTEYMSLCIGTLFCYVALFLWHYDTILIIIISMVFYYLIV